MPEVTRNELEIWLNSRKNRAWLKKVASKILNKMQGSGHVIRGMVLDAEEVEQEIALILLQDESAARNLIKGGTQGLIRVRKILYSRMLDLCRSGKDNQDIHKNTWQLFYRNVLDVLGKSNRFIKITLPSTPIRFSLSNRPPRCIVVLDDFLDIPYPVNLPANYEQVNTGKVILELAAHFWDRAARRAGDPGIRFSANEFIAWVQQYVSLNRSVDTHPTGGGEKEDINPLLDHPGRRERDSATEKTLTLWADNFINRLEDTEKKVFFFRQCQDLPHKEISVRMGKKGNMSYWMDRSIDKLKSFLRPLDLLAPEFAAEDGFKDDFQFFMNMVCMGLGLSLREIYP